MDIIEKCKDYEILKNELPTSIMKKIKEVLYKYENNNIKQNKTNTYIEECIIKWYEGLTNTEDFIEAVSDYIMSREDIE